MLESLEKLFQQFRDLGEFARDLLTWITAFGSIVLLIINIKYILALCRAIKLYFINQLEFITCCRIDFKQKYGQWAVISGATDGIGLALARELACKGMSIVIIGRNDEKLARVKGDLEREQNVGQIVALKKDFSNSSLDSYRELFSQIELATNSNVGILINNVGIFMPKMRKFNEENDDYLKETVDVNILSTVMLTKAILPAMIERKCGLIVNVSSISDSFTCGHYGIYAPTKAFVKAFSSQLQCEYRHLSNLKIVNLTPGLVLTKPFEQVGLSSTTTTTTTAAAAASENSKSLAIVFARPNVFARSVVNILTIGNHPLHFCGLAKHALAKRVQVSLDHYGLLNPLVERLNSRR